MTTVDQAIGELGDLLARREEADDPEAFAGYRDDPIGFIREVVGEEPWDRQVEVAKAVRDNALVAVYSANGTGKDWLAARLCLWWATARRGLAVVTGPTRQQVEETLMRKEVADAFRRAGSLPGELHVRAYRPGGEGRAGIIAKTASEVSGLTGLHDAEVLICISEAQAEDLDVAFRAAFANAVGERDRILAYGQPLNPTGPFYRASRPSSDWRSIRIPASDVPNVRQDRVVVPGLMTTAGVDRMVTQYGPDSGYVEARVHARFPEQGEDALFRASWIEEAAERWARRQSFSRSMDAIPVAAVDPARHGPDASVMALRRGDVVEELVAWEGSLDTTELVKEVRWALQDRGFEADGSGDRRVRVIVDEVGLGGGVLDGLREEGWRARGFNGGRRPIDADRHFNRRAESYWILRDRLEEGDLAMIWSDELREELLAIRWQATPRGKIQLESKRDLASRIGRSPDRADAVAMACYPWPRVGRSGDGDDLTRVGVASA